MEETKLSRRQFLGGTAAVAAATVLPVVTAAAPAVATPTGKLADAAASLTPWIPLDAKAAARHGLEIYRGMHNAAYGQSG